MNDKYNSKFILPINLFFIYLIIPVLLFHFGCANEATPENGGFEKNHVLMEEYPLLFESLIRRDSRNILHFVNNSSAEVRNYAWSALYYSDITVDGELLELIRNADNEAGWTMPGYHEVDEAILQQITDWWRNEEVNRSYVCRVLGELGGIQTLEVLLHHKEVVTVDRKCALAAGRIISNHNISDRLKEDVAMLAFMTGDQSVQLRLLYGFYRNAASRPDPGTAAFQMLHEGWMNTAGDKNPVLDQYMVRILGDEAFTVIMESYDDVNLSGNLQLAIELAGELKFLNDLNEAHILRLLNHNNPHVVSQTLQSLENISPLSDSMMSYIEQKFTGEETDGQHYIETLHLINRHEKSVEPYLPGLERRISENPYLGEGAFRLYSKVKGEEDFLALLQSKIGQQNVLALQAMRALVSFWEEYGSEQTHIERIRAVFWDGLESDFVPVISAGMPLISDENFLQDSEFKRLISVIEKPEVGANYQYYKNLSGSVTSRFESQADSFIARLSEHGYGTLNDQLRASGWVIPAGKDKKPAPFWQPGWELLYESGIRPFWILDTNIGRIEVKMNPLSAPATVASIMHLSSAGSYDNLPFHRVVPNFVIQGGDVSGGTGVGGPGYLVPIEPSTTSFKRGMAGIASSGPDTEGSQFFFMNQWAPHLDGRYTLFGEVVKGMDVIDKIRTGDRIISATVVLDR